MSKELHPYDDFCKKKLENHESAVPDDLFDRLTLKRAGSAEQPSDAPYNDFFHKKLGNFASAAPDDLFDRLMREREGSDEMPSDAPLRERILEHTEAVPKPIFEAIIEERERRRRALVWRFAAAILLFFTAYLLFLNKNTPSNDGDIKTDRPANSSNDKAQATNESSNNTDITTTIAQNNGSNNQSPNHPITQSPNHPITQSPIVH